MKKIFLFSLIGLFWLQGCSDFLDVTPRGQLDQNVQFNDVQGFKDAMFGVYASMAQKQLYGKELSFGLLDVLGQTSQNNIAYAYAQNYDYLSQFVRPTIDDIWYKSYEVISYLNNIIYHLENTSLKSPDLTYIKAEALALRAFLHYDIARLFADNYQTNPQAKGIPYSYLFDLKNRKVYSLKETFDNVLKDLDEAEKLFEQEKYDASNTASLEDYPARGSNFSYYFNKYAVKALKARVFYTLGLSNQAAQYANEVIMQKDLFHLSSYDNFSKVKEFPASGEMIFGVSVNSADIAKAYSEIYLRKDQETYSIARKDLEKLYKTSEFTAENTDVRYSTYYRKQGRRAEFIRFLSDSDESNFKNFTGIPLISLSEMYYIYAESVYDSDMEKAKSLLNEVRKSRGLSAINNDLISTKELFIREMRDERMREMPGTGQIFFSLKHYQIPFTKSNGEELTPSAKTFNLPWPDKEIEFGQS